MVKFIVSRVSCDLAGGNKQEAHLLRTGDNSAADFVITELGLDGQANMQMHSDVKPERSDANCSLADVTPATHNSSCIVEEDLTEEKWTFEATKLLIATRLEMENLFVSGVRSKKTLWSKIASKMYEAGYNFSSLTCNGKFKGLLQTYRRNRAKNNKTGESKIVWPFFEAMDEVYGSKASVTPPKERLPSSSSYVSLDSNSSFIVPEDVSPAAHNSSSIVEEDLTGEKWTYEATKLLIATRLEMENLFASGVHSKKTLWGKIATKMYEAGYNFSSLTCNGKFKGLLQTYRRNKAKNNKTGESKIVWPFFKDMDKVYGRKASVNPHKKRLLPSSSYDRFSRKRRWTILEYLEQRMVFEEQQQEKEDAFRENLLEVFWEKNKLLKEKVDASREKNKILAEMLQHLGENAR